MIAEREAEKDRERGVVVLFFMFLIAVFTYSLDILVRKAFLTETIEARLIAAMPRK